MKRFTLAGAVLVLAICAQSALAQQRPGGGFGGGGPAALLAIPEVQTELGLTDAQKEKLRALRGERGNLQDLSREERQKRLEEIAKQTEETIKATLDEKQQQRLSELRIQREGANSLARAEVAEKVGLDQGQRDQIRKVLSEGMPTERPNLQNATQEERQKFLAEARERREKTTAALLAVLNAEQKEKFEKMQGAKFTFPPPARRGNQ